MQALASMPRALVSSGMFLDAQSPEPMLPHVCIHTRRDIVDDGLLERIFKYFRVFACTLWHVCIDTLASLQACFPPTISPLDKKAFFPFTTTNCGGYHHRCQILEGAAGVVSVSTHNKALAPHKLVGPRWCDMPG